MLPVILGQGGGGYYAEAVRFDGVNDYMTRGADLTGNVNGKTGIFSCWVNFNGGNGSDQYIYQSESGFLLISKNTSNKIVFQAFASSGGAPPVEVNLVSNNSITDASGWIHILAAWDVANGYKHLWINDAQDEGTASTNNDTIDYTRSDHGIGAAFNGSVKLNADIADFYLNLADYLDISAEANRRKFINADGKPANLGADGSLPTGNQPIIYLSQQSGDVPSDFGTNKGTGGNFTITGTLDSSPTSPSD